jgi:hypothetical protein
MCCEKTCHIRRRHSYTPWQPAPGTGFESPNKVDYDDPSRDMTLVAVTGIEDPLRPGVREAVAATTALVLPSRCAPGATSSPPT